MTLIQIQRQTALKKSNLAPINSKKNSNLAPFK
jgi:hypothetical protein